jgi:predicted short-subunit dehydrogenase-like oxidoreductase (DUF2520 family)
VPVEAIASRKSGVRFRDLPAYASHILIAVSDDAIEAVAREIAASEVRPQVTLHTSGAAGPGALRNLRELGVATGVLHPLQSIPDPQQGAVHLPGSTFAYAGDPDAEVWARQLIEVMSGKPLRVRPDRWIEYHAAAVMACNYHVTLIDTALELMCRAGIARRTALEALSPLIRSTTANILLSGPESALTGPIRRGDVETVRRQLEALHDVTRALYIAAGQRTIPLAVRAGLGEGSAQRLRTVLQ